MALSATDEAELDDLEEAPQKDVSLETYFDFQQAWSRSVFVSEPFGWACFHMLIGAMPHIRRLRIKRGDSWLDPRVHVFYLAGSGEGKGEGASFVGRVAKALGINTYNATDFTDAALIGTIRTSEGGEPIIHKGLLSGQTMWWNAAQGVEEERPVDILLVSEASKVLNPRPGDKDALIMNSLQIAMNTYGSTDNMVTKKLAEGPSVGYNTDVTLFMTTFLPVGFDDVILKRGLFQRTLLTVKEFKHDDKTVVTKEFFRSFFKGEEDFYFNPVTGEKSKKTTDEILNKVVKRIKEANRWAKTQTEIEVSEEAAIRLQNLILRFQGQVKNLSPFLQSKIHEFISRLMGHLVKLASHVAILNHSSVIEAEHVNALEKLHAPERFEDLITYLSNNVEEPPEFTRRVEKQLKSLAAAQKDLASRPQYRDWPAAQQGWRLKEDMVRKLAAKLRLPQGGAEELLDRHIVWGYVQVRRHGKNDFCRMVPDVAEEMTNDGNGKKRS